ncbi:MAG: transposase, partial [Alphaproteobacteria bacterium]|nr:transposase [Alphaproteobacteria bacterium]
DLCRKHGVSPATFYNWKNKYGGMEISDAQRLRELETENSKLKKLLAEAELEKLMLKELVSKNSLGLPKNGRPQES